MANTVNPPRGMRDFLPADKARREHALGVIRAGYAAQGFDEIETPVVEDASRLHSGLGGDNEKLAFGILRRGLSADAVAELAAVGDLEGLTDLGLRFDLTVPLARFYASHRAALPNVFKSIQIAPVWRAERPQKGRYRQFVQCDIDIIGEPGAIAEIELITATIATLDALGLTDYERAMITIDKEDKIGVEGVVAELVDLGLVDDSASQTVAESLSGLPDDGWNLDRGVVPPPAWLDTDAYRQLHEIRDAVAAVAPGTPLVFSHNLVRGMGYYTGAIFEIQHPELGYSLGGGGRYDGMIGRFLGTDVPAVGFSLGFERIVDLITVPEDRQTDGIVLVYDRDVEPATLLRIKTQLVGSGARVRLERRVKNLKPLLERLADAGYTRFAPVMSVTRQVSDLQFRDLA
jgi:histidyl-tRNA synthetase